MGSKPLPKILYHGAITDPDVIRPDPRRGGKIYSSSDVSLAMLKGIEKSLNIDHDVKKIHDDGEELCIELTEESPPIQVVNLAKVFFILYEILAMKNTKWKPVDNHDTCWVTEEEVLSILNIDAFFMGNIFGNRRCRIEHPIYGVHRGVIPKVIPKPGKYH